MLSPLIPVLKHFVCFTHHPEYPLVKMNLKGMLKKKYGTYINITQVHKEKS